MKRTIRRFLHKLSPYAKYLWLVVYLAAAAGLWPLRDLLPVPALLDGSTRDTIVASLLLLGFVCLVDLLRRPFGIARRARETFLTAGLTNAQGETPALRSVRADRDKPHGKILEVWNKGISMADFDAKVHRLEAGLGGKVYNMEYARGAKTTRLFLLPMKYIHPTIINPNDEALGAIHVRDLINLLVVGATGTGKTVAIKTVMKKIVGYQSEFSLSLSPSLWLLDYKQMDFRAYTDLPHYYGYTDCVQGLEDYYTAFKEAQASGVAGVPQYLVMDEWGSFIMSLPKKEAERCKSLLAELLMLGRGYRFFPIIGIQRPDAGYFNAARDNFQACLALGNLSPEGRRMVFPDSVTGQLTECRKREGHLYIDGKGLEKVRMADIADLDALDASIRAAIPTTTDTGGAGGEAEREPADPPAAEGGLT